jgi:hypothetical protein
MIVDLYMRDPEDPLYVPDTLEVKNDLDVLLGQIRMLLFTKPGEVVSRINFGIDLESQIFSLNVSNSALENLILSQIYDNCPNAELYEVTVKVSFFYGVSRDVCLIDIFVDGTKYLGILVK